VYFCTILSSSEPNLIYIILFHCDQSFISSLCVSHYLVGFAFKTTYSDRTLCCLGTFNSNSFTNMLISINTSYLCGSHNSIPIQHKDRVMCAHRLVDTSCIHCCQCSRPSFEYDVHELMLLQLSTPSTIGLT
jgi:hypothetical protein